MSETVEIVNREHWLENLARELVPLLKEQGKTMPKWRISCSWPSRRAHPTGSKMGHRIGECWAAENSKDGTREIMISPLLDDPLKIADVALHEMCHAVLPPGVGHKSPFAKLAVAVGLEGKPTATEAGDELKEKLKAIIDRLGPYPHAAITSEGGRKQTTRLVKIICPVCGQILRTTRKSIDEMGYPFCGLCQVEFLEPDDEEFQENPLVMREQALEFAIKGDDRYAVRMSRKVGGNTRWYVIDYGPQEIIGDRAVTTSTLAESREDAINIVESVKTGLLKLRDLTYEDPTADADEFDDDVNWGELKPTELDDLLADNEEEIPDNPDEEYDPERDEYPKPDDEITTMEVDES